MKKNLWGGRFKKELDEDFKEFSRSLGFDYRLFVYEIFVNRAWAKALHKAKVLSQKEYKSIDSSLERIALDFIQKKLKIDFSQEDVHTWVLNLLTKKVPAAKKLHTGRSRNDLVVTEFRLYLKNEAEKLILSLKQLQAALLKFAAKNKEVIIPGYTHLKRAQPLFFAQLIFSYLEAFQRDRERLADCLKRIDLLPLGSAALAGTSFNIDRRFLKKELGFGAVMDNSLDAVTARDFALEFSSALTIIAVNFSRVSEDLIIFNSDEFSFIELPDEFSTGSSIMPHKKNPDLLELSRAAAATVIGNNSALLSLLKNLPSGYNRDFQNDKIYLFSSLDLISQLCRLWVKFFKKLKIKKEGIASALKDEFLYATDIMEYLAKKGLPVRQAHEAIGKLIQYCLRNKKKLSNLSLSEYKRFSRFFKEDIYQIISPQASVSLKATYGSTSPSQVKRQLKKWQGKINALL